MTDELVREYRRVTRRGEKPSPEARAAYNEFKRRDIQRRKYVQHPDTPKRKRQPLAEPPADSPDLPVGGEVPRPAVWVSPTGPPAVPLSKEIRTKARPPHPEPFRPVDPPRAVTKTWYFRQSEIKAFKSCPRSWWLQYQRGGAGYQKPPTDKPSSGQRDVGTLVHAGLDAYYSGLDYRVVLADAKALLQEQLGAALPKEWLDVFVLSDIMVSGYIQWLGTEYADVGETTLFTEKDITIPIGTMHGDEVVLTCKVDRIVQDNLSGEVIIEDTKTVDTFGQYVVQLQVDDQGLMYAIMARGGLGLSVNRFRHNMLRKVKRTAAANPPFYMRHEAYYSEEQLDNAWVHMVSVVSRMVLALQAVGLDEAQHHAFLYPNPTRDCTWKCDFLPICPMMDDGSYWQDMIDSSGLYVPRPGRLANV